MAPQIPLPYTSIEQYERSIRIPIGREWNTAHTFRKFIQPAVVAKVGKLIEPINMTDAVTQLQRLAKESRKARSISGRKPL